MYQVLQNLRKQPMKLIFKVFFIILPTTFLKFVFILEFWNLDNRYNWDSFPYFFRSAKERWSSVFNQLLFLHERKIVIWYGNLLKTSVSNFGNPWPKVVMRKLLRENMSNKIDEEISTHLAYICYTFPSLKDRL